METLYKLCLIHTMSSWIWCHLNYQSYHAQKTSKVKSIEKCIVEVIKMLNSKCYTETLHLNRQERDGHIQTLIKAE